jgi:hypothetical protein
MICPECNHEVEVDRGRFVKHEPCPGWFLQTDWAGDPKSEGRFTVSRPDCPHPERWHSRDADSTEHEVTELVAAFVRALQPDVVVETGSAWGQTAEAIGRALKENGQGMLHTMEPDPVRRLFTLERCLDLPVEVHLMTSMEWIAKPPFEFIDFAWFDSLHPLRVPEFKAFYPYMTDRTVVGFHDTGPHQGGLREEIEDLELAAQLLPIHLPTPRGVTFGEVIK